MIRTLASAACVQLFLVGLVASATFLAAPPRAYAVPTTETPGPLLLADILTSIKQAVSTVLDFSNTAANVAKQVKAYVLDPIAFLTSGNLLKKITSSILGFVGGNNASGKPLYISNLRGYLQNVGDVEAYTFLNEFQRQSNSPFKSAIGSSLRSKYLQSTSLTGFFAANKSTLKSVSSDPLAYAAGNWSRGGWAAWFGLTGTSADNPYIYYYRADDQLSRQLATARSAKLAQANWGQGILSWCGSVDSGADGADYYAVDCPEGSIHAGDGGCACTAETTTGACVNNQNQFVIPTDYSCPSESSFDGNSGGCQYDDGTLTYALDEEGYPATEGGMSGAAQDFANSGDPYAGKPDTTARGDGTSKVSAASGVSLTGGQVSYLADLLGTASKVLPAEYRVVVTSAERNTNVAGGGGVSQHASGNAIDFKIIDASGASIPNRGEDSTGWYQKVAVAAYNANTGSCNLAWGGCFDTGKNTGVKDPMHLDCGGDRGRYCSSGLAGLAGGGTVGPTGVTGTTVATAEYTPPSSTSYAIPRPGDACTKKDGTYGTIQTPGSIIKDYLSRALNALGIDQYVADIGLVSTQIGGIMQNVSTIFSTINYASSLFGASGGLAGFSGTGTSYASPFARYLADPGYMGLTTANVAASAAASGISGNDLASRSRDYGAAWDTIGGAADAAAASLTALAASCSAQAAAASAALASEVKPVEDQAAAARETVASANALVARVAAEGAEGDPNYAADLAALAAAPPSVGDVVAAQNDAQSNGLAMANPAGSLTVGGTGATPRDIMDLIKTNADALARNPVACPSSSDMTS